MDPASEAGETAGMSLSSLTSASLGTHICRQVSRATIHIVTSSEPGESWTHILRLAGRCSATLLSEESSASGRCQGVGEKPFSGIPNRKPAESTMTIR
jgi:hypothetical protein